MTWLLLIPIISIFLWLINFVTPLSSSVLRLILGGVLITIAFLLFRRRQKLGLKIALVPLLIFVTVFILGLLLRGWGIVGPEYIYQNSLINSLLTSTRLPPPDLWFAGHPLNYYYFGYYWLISLTKIIGQRFIFNWYFPLFYSLLAVALYLVLKKVLVSKTHILFGILIQLFGGSLFSAIFVLGRLIPGLPFASSIVNLNNLALGAVIIIKNDICDFPLNNYFLGHLHPYIINQLFIILFIGVLVKIILDNKPRWYEYVGLGLLLGAVFLTNPWDFLIYGLLGVVTLLPKLWCQGVIKVALLTGIPLVVIIVPFLLTYQAPVTSVSLVKENYPYPLYFLLAVGIFMWPAIKLTKEAISSKLLSQRLLVLSISLPTALLLAYLLFALKTHLEITSTLLAILWRLPLLFSLALFSLPILTINVRKEPIKFLSAVCFWLVILLATIAEFFYVRDSLAVRFNTFIKLYFNMWLLSSLGFILSWSYLKLSKKILVLYLSLALVFPIYYIVSVPKNSFDLSDQSNLRRLYPTDSSAINWIRQNPSLTGQVILEGATYTSRNPRISSFTGNPTVIGIIPGYEALYRRPYDWGAVVNDIRDIYTTNDINLFWKLAKKYNISYVYLGDSEKSYFPVAGNSFQEFGIKLIYNDGQAKIYKL